MNFPAALFVIRWLGRDTFCQALASRTFWLMLTISALAIVFCLGVAVENGQPLRPSGEIELFGGDHKPLTGPNPQPGTMTLAFGAVRLALFRDGLAQVRFLQTLLAVWVAGTIGTLAALIWTAGFLPSFLEPSAASVLLAKPVPRWVLLLGKVLGVLGFVAFQELVFFGGTWMALGFKTGIWAPAYLLAMPILLLHFAIIYSFSALIAVFTRSTVAALFGGIVFWFVCYAMNYGHHALTAFPYLGVDMTPFSPLIRAASEAGYWLLPKPGDLVIMLDHALQASEHFDLLPREFRVVVEHGHFAPDLSVLTSLLFSGGMLAAAARQLSRTDY